ncbi:MAG: outer membrane protein OmpK [Methylomicrobium sp.]
MKPAVACSMLLCGTLHAHAFDWTSSNAQILYGETFEFGDPKRVTATVEHAHGWQYGTHFFFVDVADRNDIGVEVYAELYSYLSWNKTTGRTISFGPVKDVSLVLGLNIGNEPERDHFKAYMFGLSFDLAKEWSDYLQLDITVYKADDLSGRYGIQFTPVWSIPFTLGGVNFKFRGFTDFRTGNTNAPGNFNILAQPQMLLDIGALAGWRRNTIYIGTEYSYWHNKYGVKNVDESVVQGMIIGFF